MKRIFSALLCAVIFMQAAAFAAEYTNVSISINGKAVTLIRPMRGTGESYMLPFKELMALMGFYVGYDEEQAAYIGTVNGTLAQVPTEGNKACYDQVWIELENPLIALEDDVLVELEFIERLYGISCTRVGNSISFKLELLVTEEKDTEELDVDEYLAGITPKSINISQEDLFKAEISSPELVAMRVVEVEDAPGFTKAVEVDNLTEPELFYRAQITIPTSESVAAGDVLVASFYARKIKCVDESGFSKINATYEAIDVDWTKFQNNTEEVPETWTKYRYAFTVSKELKAGAAHYCLRVGFRYQTVQFGGLEIVNYGKRADLSVLAPEKVIKTSYYGREDGALWREEALRRIEKYRKNDMTVHVADENGNPVPNAKVSANMTRSEFLWGTAVNEKRAFNTRRTSIFYDGILSDKFNSITLESNMKPAAFRIRNCVYGVNFARENNMYFRAHAVLWDAPNHFPAEITADSTEEEVYDFCLRHASKLIYNFGDSFDEIDVVNEPLNNSTFRDKYGTDFIVKLYQAVHDMAPNARLFLNETGMVGNDTNWPSAAKLKGIIDELLEKGAPLEGLGMQNHAAGMIYPQVLYNQLDYIAENLKYISITEYDYLSNLSDNTEALQIEADYLRDSIIMAYSHPKMTGFTMWGFGDLGHWRLNAPLYFETYAPKPALKYWNQYVWGEWFTQEEAVTDENGNAVIRGHRGDYDITVEADGKTAATTLALTKDGQNTVDAVLGADGIKLQSSQEVSETLPQISMLSAIYGEKDSEYAYKTLYENLAVSAKRSDGGSVDFLLDEENAAICSVNKDNSVTVRLDKPLDSGYVAVKTEGLNKSLLKIELRSEDGVWKQIYAGEFSEEGIGVCFNDSAVCEIRISGMLSLPAVLKYVKISQKEDRRL